LKATTKKIIFDYAVDTFGTARVTEMLGYPIEWIALWRVAPAPTDEDDSFPPLAGDIRALIAYLKREKVVVTNHDFPPIPLRDMDWSAVADDYEPGCPSGHGPTEEEAIADLIEQFTEEN